MHWSEFLIVSMLLIVVVGSLSAWTWFFQRRKNDRPTLLYSERTAVPWGMIDIAIVIVIMFLLQSLGAGMTRVIGDASVQDDAISPVHMLSFSIASLATWALSVCFIMTRTSASIADLGCDRPRDEDIRQGAVVFFLLALPVFGVQLILAWLWQESQHPLIELMETRPEAMTFIVSSFAAVIVAPLVEEFFFRVIVQGWLENIAALWRHQKSGNSFSRSFANEIFLGRMRPVQSDNAMDGFGDTSKTGAVPESMEPGNVLANPYQSPSSPGATHPDVFRVDSHADLEMRPATWPIVVSAALFAVAHFGNGPDPIPLFILALGLGYLYRQTHRIWPCIVVHMMLNSLSMAQLWLHTQSLPLAR